MELVRLRMLPAVLLQWSFRCRCAMLSFGLINVVHVSGAVLPARVLHAVLLGSCDGFGGRTHALSRGGYAAALERVSV